MNRAKAETKLALVNQLGAEIEDVAEQHEKEQYRYEGGISTAKQTVEALKVLMLHVNRDLDEEKFDEAAADLLREWLQKAVESAGAIGKQKDALRLIALGKTAGVRQIVGRMKKHSDAEQAKLDRVAADSNGREHIDIPAVADLAARKENHDTDPRP